MIASTTMLALVVVGQAQSKDVRNASTRIRWETEAVGPKVSDYWAEQRMVAERAVGTLRKSSPTVRDKVIRDAATRPIRDTIPNEQGYLTAHYLVSFRTDIVRLNLPERLQTICIMSTGTRDPEFLRMMYLAKVTFFGQSIGLGLVKVFPDDISVKEVFVEDPAVLKASLENVRTAQKILREDLARTWSEEKVAHKEASLQGAVLLHTRKESDMNLAIQLWQKAVKLDPTLKQTAEFRLKLFKARYDRGEIIKGQ